MEKSIATKENAVFLAVLRQVRVDAGITQTTLAERIGETQSFVSKVERGELRLDVIQLRTFCLALDTDLAAFVSRFELRLRSRR